MPARRARLAAWREHAARAADLLPDQICTDDELAAIANTPPADADELSSMTGFGPLTATRMFASIKAALDGAGVGA